MGTVMRSSKEKMIAERLLRIMKNKKVTQKELADKLGVTQGVISKTLNSENGYPLTDTYIRKICDTLMLDYGMVISASTDMQSGGDDCKNDKRLTELYLEKRGINIVHVIVLNSVIYRADKISNYQFTSDSVNMHTLDEIRRIEKTENHDGQSDEYYELSYNDVIRKFTAQDYDALIENINSAFQNVLNLMFI